ncbi:MAG TPA: UDP-N-acetylmuramoyl-L-alanyl-D-glutamate--2,6-diaminopimelate ligase [Firmicutes bacterium]|mgnify:CR=1 FL=1|nr:UDP-N-acetylmuramoyl-L-alanyl-D-glutamate--2,6-diaminopimelate ligase [Candidatus Fermentithermobacillaceae bacterium]
MRFSELLRDVKGARLLGDSIVTGISYDSRRVMPGHVFVAVKGERTDGHLFIPQAIEKGASAVIVEDESRAVENPGVAVALVPDSRLALSLAAKAFFKDPSAELLVVGITGTKGKTTTCHLVKSVLDASGERTGLIGTVHNIVGQEIRPVTHTTPESSDLQNLFRDMVEAGCTAATMEVSSHALAMGRVKHIRFDAAVLTNIGRDHLDYHGTLERYMEAKATLFSELGLSGEKRRDIPPVSVLNVDDEAYEYFRGKVRTRLVTYGMSPSAEVRCLELVLDREGSRFVLALGDWERKLRLSLPGRFNVMNALAAAAVGYGLGMDKDAIVKGLEACPPVRGRVETVPGAKEFSIWVDYAHTPESLKGVLETAREMTQGRVIAVFGCGGDRDKGKRPIMGQIAAQLCELTIITNDNPRTEDPEAILDDIERGFESVPGEHRHLRISDRREAIREAVARAKPGDIVVIAGKGHETYQIIGDRVNHFDDVEEAREAVLERKEG